ncbi:MAG: protein kinase domain-containing protein [Polyangiales bacterium]
MTSVDLPLGTMLGGDFRIVRPLRVGGMGAVYVAEQRSTGALRALKTMQRELVSDPSLRERFEQEARIGASIDSDHVVQVLGAGIDEGTGIPWLAMELLEGIPLDLYLNEKGARAPGEVRYLFEQLCHALGAAHARGIVHRDLKPANVFLGRPRMVGLSYVVKVLDFGIAKVLAEAKTTKTAAVGTPLYMAPEQYEAGKVTPATDVWALGLIAFELLTGRSYWKGAGSAATPASIMYETCLGELSPASNRLADLGLHTALPDGFDAWFGRCVERKPEARFPDARAAFEALAPVLGAATPPSDPLPNTTPRVEVRTPPTKAMPEPTAAMPTPATVAMTTTNAEAPRASKMPLALGMAFGIAILAGLAGLWARKPAATPQAPVTSAAPAPPSASVTKPTEKFAVASTVGVEGRLLHARIAPGARLETYLMLDLRGADATPKKPAPVHLSLVIDRSGSMKGDRLKNAVAAAVTAIERLRDGDQVSVIAFDDKADAIVAPTTLDPTTRTAAVAAVKKLALGGNTCISCGLSVALERFGTTGEGWARRIVLLSDGEANVGVKDVPGFERIAQGAQKSDVNISTIGVGDDYDPRGLTALSRESNGQHYYAANEAALPAIFDAEAKALGAVVADSTEASIRLAPGVQLLSVLDRAHRVDGDTVHVPLGQFAKNERKTVLIKIAVRALEDGAIPVAHVDVVYRDLISSGAGKTSGELAIGVGDAAPLDPVVELRVKKSETNVALLEAGKLFDQGKVKDADALLQAQCSLIDAKKKTWTENGVAPELIKGLDDQRQMLDAARKQYVVAVAAAQTSGVSPMKAPPAKAQAKKSMADAYSNGL